MTIFQRLIVPHPTQIWSLQEAAFARPNLDGRRLMGVLGRSIISAKPRGPGETSPPNFWVGGTGNVLVLNFLVNLNFLRRLFATRLRRQHLNAFCAISTAFWMRCKSMLIQHQQSAAKAQGFAKVIGHGNLLVSLKCAVAVLESASS